MDVIENNTKLIFNCGVARNLLKKGCVIVDIKPDRSNSETGKEKTIFCFLKDETFKKAFAEINNEIAAKVTENDN